MAIDRTAPALKFFNSVIEEHGYNPDDVASVLAIFDNMTYMEDVALRVEAKTDGGPYTALGIFAVETNPRYRLSRMTNRVVDATGRNDKATDYLQSLSRRINHRVASPFFGSVGDREGYAHMGSGYFVAESGLVLPRGGVIDLTVTIPFSETARSRRAAAV